MSRGGRAAQLAARCWLRCCCCCRPHRHVIVDCRLHVHLLRLHMSDDAIDALEGSRHWMQREGQGNEQGNERVRRNGRRIRPASRSESDADETNEDFASAAAV